MSGFEAHPLSDLTIAEGKVIWRSGRNRGAEYLVTPPVSIAAKDGFHETSTNDVVYTFRLNCAPDQTWIQFFKRHNEKNDASIDNDNLYLRCIPANLEGRYQLVKGAIDQANRLYPEFRTLLSARVAELDVKRQQEADAQTARTTAVTDQFGNLPL
jgi:hypothetical protein